MSTYERPFTQEGNYLVELLLNICTTIIKLFIILACIITTCIDLFIEILVVPVMYVMQFSSDVLQMLVKNDRTCLHLLKQF